MINKIEAVSKGKIRWAISAFFFGMGFCFSNWATRIPDIKTSLGMNDADWGTTLLMMPIGQVLAMTIVSPLISKFGSKNIVITSFCCFIVPFTFIAFISTQYLLMATLLFFGFFGNICTLAVNTQGVNLEKIYKRPIMSSLHASWSISNVIGAITGILLLHLGLNVEAHFIVISFIACFALLLGKKLLPDYIIDELRAINTNEDKKAQGPKKRFESFLIVLGLIGFCGIAMEATVADWGAIYFKRIVEAPSNLHSLGFTAFTITMALGRFTSDKIIEKIKERWFLILSGLLIIIGVAITTIAPDLITSTLAFIIIGLGVSCISPVIFSIAARKTTISVQAALTLISGIAFTGFLTIPPLTGYISHVLNLRYAFGAVGILGILIIVLVLTAPVFRKITIKNG